MNPQPPQTRRAFLRIGSYATVSAIAGSAFLSACGSDADKTAKPADADGATKSAEARKLTGTLNFVNFEGWLGANTAAAFTKAFPGADLNQIPIAGTQESWLPKVKDRRGDYDLALVDGATIPKLIALDALASFTAEEVPNATNVDPAFRNQAWDPDNKYFVATDYGRTGIGYRKDIVTEPITSYADMFALLPKYSGKVAVLSRMGSTLGMAMKRLGYSVNSNDPAEVAALAFGFSSKVMGASKLSPATVVRWSDAETKQSTIKAPARLQVAFSMKSAVRCTPPICEAPVKPAASPPPLGF